LRVPVIGLLALVAAGAAWLGWFAGEEPAVADANITAPANPLSSTSLADSAASKPNEAPAQAASSAASATTTKPRVITSDTWQGFKIGSEGYGPHIVELSTRGDGNESLAAYRQILSCGYQEEREKAFDLTRALANPKKSVYETADYLNQEALKLATERNRCQTVDDQVKGLSITLTKRAAEAGVEGAAEAYADTVVDAGRADLWPTALQYLRAAANRMDSPAFTMLAFGDRTIPLGDVERTAYQITFDRLEMEGWQSVGGGSRRVGRDRPAYDIKLTEAQNAEAARRAKEIYAACCEGWKSRTQTAQK